MSERDQVYQGLATVLGIGLIAVSIGSRVIWGAGVGALVFGAPLLAFGVFALVILERHHAKQRAEKARP